MPLGIRKALREARNPATAGGGAPRAASPDRSVVLGEQGAFAGMQPGAVLVDHTTASAQVARELAEQVLQSFLSYGQHLPLTSYAVYGGVSINPQMMKLRKGVDVLVATPGRLLDLYRQNAVKFSQLQTLVLDEADRMLDLGFARELDELFSALPKKRQTLLFSATFSDAIRQMAGELLRDPLSVEVSPRNAAAKTVKQWLIPVDKKRKSELFLHLLQENRWGQVLVFAKTRKGVDQLEQELLAMGVAADSIHGDKPQPSRLRALERFKAGEVQILVATDVAARGLDIDDLPLVVNLDLPINAEDYVHRIGRTARAGKSGIAIAFCAEDERAYLKDIRKVTGAELERLPLPDNFRAVVEGEGPTKPAPRQPMKRVNPRPLGQRPQGDRKPQGDRRPANAPQGERRPQQGEQRRAEGDRKPQGERRPEGDRRAFGAGR